MDLKRSPAQVLYTGSMNTIQLKVTNNRLHDYGLPDRLTDQGAGYALRAASDEPVILYPEETVRIPTGVALGLFDPHLAGFICPMDELARYCGVVLQNGATPISTDDQQELVVGLRNDSQDICRINPGDVIALLVFVPIAHPVIEVVAELKAPSPEPKTLAPGALTDLGLGHSPGTQDDLFNVFPADLVGNDEPPEDPTYTKPDLVTQNQVLNPPDGLDEALADYE